MIVITLAALLFLFCLLMNIGVLASVVVVELFLVLVFWLNDSTPPTSQFKTTATHSFH